jgi:hypothetical protein
LEELADGGGIDTGERQTPLFLSRNTFASIRSFSQVAGFERVTHRFEKNTEGRKSPKACARNGNIFRLSREIIHKDPQILTFGA